MGDWTRILGCSVLGCSVGRFSVGVSVVLAPVVVGCVGGNDAPGATSPALVERFGEHGRAVLAHDPVIASTAAGLTLTATMPAGTPLRGAVASGGMPALPAVGSPAVEAVLALPTDARDALSLGWSGRAPLHVYEEGASGASEPIGGAVSYAREGGRSYWTVSSGGGGFEEWLALDAGLARGDRVLARWRVEGHTLREVPSRGGVHVIDHDGAVVAYVSAPEAWTASGARLVPSLAVEGDAIVLRLDAGGEAVLVDPMWSRVGAMLTRHGSLQMAHGATRLDSGLVLIEGGYSGVAPFYESSAAELFDPATDAWTTTGAMSERRRWHASGLLADGRVLVSGGYEFIANSDTDCTESTHATAEIYDPAAGTWSATGSLAQARHHHSQTLLGDGRVLVAGGFTTTSTACSGDGTGTATATAELFDPAAGTWSAAAPLATARRLHTATRLSDGRVLVVGGSTAADPIASAEIYDAATNAWTSTGDLAVPRRTHTATRLPDGRVLVTGGESGGMAVATCEIFDPATGTWTAAADMSTPRYLHTATLLATGRVLVSAGYAVGAAARSSEEYDPDTNTWSTPTTMLARFDGSATLMLDGRVLMAGGFLQDDPLGLATEAYVPDPGCGNGLVEFGEECDDGNVDTGDCCSPTCTLEAAGTTCRASVDDCDAAETCTGTSGLCPDDSFQPNTFECRAAGAECSVPTLCSGTGPACPVCREPDAGASPDAATAPDAGTSPTPDAAAGTPDASSDVDAGGSGGGGGCSCAVPSRRTEGTGAALGLLALLGLAIARRRR